MDLAKKKDQWFSYYANYFQTVEINSTFYRPPGELQVQSWIKKARDRKDFEYSVKVPQLVTHKALVEKDLARAIFWATSFEKTCVKPLAESDLLGGVLFQLSPYFRNAGSALASLKGVLDAVSYELYDYAVEFRHTSWLGEEKREIEPATLEALSERNVANVLIDGPGLHIAAGPTVNHARYDFLYQADQLAPWVPLIKDAELKAAKVRIYFNNHARAKSVRNAFLLMDMLHIEHKSKEIHLQDQFTLGEF